MKSAADDPQVWLAYADSDLLLARRALDTAPVIPHGASFHAQQAAEKCLKAFLLARGAEVPRSHNLNLLVTLCRSSEPAFAGVSDACEQLNEFGAAVRYPPAAFDLPDESQARQALALAEQVTAFVRARLK